MVLGRGGLEEGERHARVALEHECLRHRVLRGRVACRALRVTLCAVRKLCTCKMPPFAANCRAAGPRTPPVRTTGEVHRVQCPCCVCARCAGMRAQTTGQQPRTHTSQPGERKRTAHGGHPLQHEVQARVVRRRATGGECAVCQCGLKHLGGAHVDGAQQAPRAVVADVRCLEQRVTRAAHAARLHGRRACKGAIVAHAASTPEVAASAAVQSEDPFFISRLSGTPLAD